MSRWLGRPAPLHRLREQVVLAVWMKRRAGHAHGTRGFINDAEKCPAESDGRPGAV